MSNKNASIIAIGTEITSGQTKNTHATWISAQLDDYGITPTHHVAVPDDQELILAALNYASDNSEFIFITGGLGPTRDDFTRNVIADWLDCKLVFNNEAWEELQQRLNDRNVKISPNHKNQCYFPAGSEILRNTVGTAHGFYFKYKSKHFWVLPGPPPELMTIWTAHIAKQLLALTDGKSFEIKKWRCLGLPESEVADITEDILKGSGLQTGYRLAPPYVEIKVWTPISKSINAWIEKLDHALSDWTVSRNEEDIAQSFLDLTLTTAPLIIIDDTTQGHLSERLMPLVRAKPYVFEVKSLFSTAADLGEILFDGHGTILKLAAIEDSLSWRLEIKSSKLNMHEIMQFNSTQKLKPERLGKIKTELSLKKATEWLRRKP